MIEDTIRRIVNLHVNDANFDFNYDISPMAYNHETNTFKYSERLCQQESKNYEFDYEHFVILLTYHEIGHYLDFLNNPHKAEFINIPSMQDILELGAWEYGKIIIPEDLQDDFDEVNSRNYRYYSFIIHNKLI
ncbi:hypothetical protein MKY95_19330 [Paenibacillus sp. FSL P4-0176]|uniref:hypothetical protein n=1 Tax=Paenibacillus sp. FSL P4-0176 TaxID=2921631 RepID=UPI0030CF6376